MVAAAHDSIRKSRQAALRVFLRTHRARVTAASAGLPLTSARRMKGLRREDVAELAGVSLGWYARFELGQLDGVSERVVDAIAQALKLSNAEACYLRRLAHSVAAQAEQPEDEHVSDVLRGVIEAHTGGPAGVLNSRFDALAINAAARRILFASDGDGLRRNFIWRTFLDPAHGNALVDAGERRRNVAAMLRNAYASHVGDPNYEALIAELRAQSAEFVRAWDELSVLPFAPGEVLFRYRGHVLTFSSVVLSINDIPGQQVIFMTARDSVRFHELMAEEVN